MKIALGDPSRWDFGWGNSLAVLTNPILERPRHSALVQGTAPQRIGLTINDHFAQLKAADLSISRI